MTQPPRKNPEGLPEQPTMVNPAWAEWRNTFENSPEALKKMRVPPEEMADDIVALPLSMPDFANNIQPHLVNQNLVPRWIFTDRRRYAEARSQGFRNCTRADLKADFATLNPYEEDAGLKYVNGDLILMLTDRKRYLGALRRKHEQAERLGRNPNERTARAVAVEKARAELGETANAINRMREAQGQGPLIEAFDPKESDLHLDAATAQAVGRMGHTGKPDTGTGKDLAKGR